MDLETKLSQTQEELSIGSPLRSNSSGPWLPRPPEKLSLTGHRSPINRVSFHPVYTLLASASEDATIKIWDFESGEHEKTLKGHTKSVHDICFNEKGDILGIVLCKQQLIDSFSLQHL